jgi:hypothetical protein
MREILTWRKPSPQCDFARSADADALRQPSYGV